MSAPSAPCHPASCRSSSPSPRVGLDLGPVQTDRAQLHQPHRLRHQQDLHEQRFELAKEALSEIRDGTVIGIGVGADEAKRNRVVGGLRQLAAGEQASGIAVEQQRHQHRRMVGRRARPPVSRHQMAQIQLINDVDDEPCQVFLRQVILYARRKQLRCVPVNR